MADNLTQFNVTEEAGGDMDLVRASKNGDAAAVTTIPREGLESL
jgi:hypothetical protein